MTALSRPAVLETAHKGGEDREIERPVLEVVADGVGIGLCVLLTSRVSRVDGLEAADLASADGVDLLAVFPQLDRLVGAPRLVVEIGRGRLHARIDGRIAPSAAFVLRTRQARESG